MASSGLSAIVFRLGAAGLQAGLVVATGAFYGPEGRGKIAALVVTSGFAAAVAGLSLSKGLLRVFEMRRGGTQGGVIDLCDAAVVAYVLSTAGVMGLTAAVFVVFPALFGAAQGAAIIALCAMTAYHNWLPIGETLYSLAGRAVWSYRMGLVSACANFMICMLLVTVWRPSVDVFLFVYATSSVGLTAFEIWLFRRGLDGPVSFCWADVKRLFSASAVPHVDTIGGTMLTTGSLLVINAKMPSSELGLYDFANRIVAFVVVGSSVFRRFIIEHLGQLGLPAATAGIWKITKRAVWMTILIVVAVAVTAPFAVQKIVPDFYASTGYMLVLLVIAPCSALVNCLSPLWFASGDYRFLIGCTSALGVYVLVMSLVLVDGFGAWGGVAASTSAYILAAAINVLRFRRIA